MPHLRYYYDNMISRFRYFISLNTVMFQDEDEVTMEEYIAFQNNCRKVIQHI